MIDIPSSETPSSPAVLPMASAAPSKIGCAIFRFLRRAAAAMMRASSPSGKTILRSRRRAISNRRSIKSMLLTV